MGYTNYYTNGSISQNGRATYGVYANRSNELTNTCEEIAMIGRLRDNVGYMHSELVAIGRALRHADNMDNVFHRHVCIHTDSPSALLALHRDKPHDNHNLIVDIKQQIQKIIRNGRDLTFNWVPSHIGIIGNELADALANMVSRLDTITDHIDPSMKSGSTDITKKLHTEWSNNIKSINGSINGNTTARYTNINPTLDAFKSILSSRELEVLWFKYRLSMGNKCTHMCPLKCDKCGIY